MTSIRRRTAVLVVAATTAMLAAGGATLFLVLRHALTAQFDETLAARADALRSITLFDGVKIEMDFARDALPRYHSPPPERAGEAEYFLVWTRENDHAPWRELEHSESLAGHDWPDTAQLSRGVHDVTLPAGASRAGRAIVQEFTVAWEGSEERTANPHATPPEMKVLAAAPRRPLDRALAAAAWSLVGVGGALAIASVAASRWAVRRGLIPLTDLSARIAAIGPATLDSRVEGESLPAELRPIAEQLSALLARLHNAFEREKRFTSAASHELRTPIAELRMLLEVSASRTRSAAEWAVVSERALGVLDRTQSLCEALLRLSRAESGSGGARPAEPLALAPLLHEHAARAAALHAAEARTLRIHCPPGLTVHTDPAALAIILANLFDNALRHGEVTPDLPAECEAHSADAVVTVTVRNHAPDLAPQDVPRLFEPFWQADASRTARKGFGLGLSVCRALAKACGGRIEARREEPNTLAITLSMPAATSPHATP